jgi:formylglycine-generating enzyme required for sulfatase activity
MKRALALALVEIAGFARAAPPPQDTAGSVVSLRSPAPLMVRIPAGNFVRGSTMDEIMAALASCMREPLANRCEEHGGFVDEVGRATLWLPAFYIDRTEVTVAAYARCVAAGSCEAPGHEKGATRFARPDYPVTFVNFDDASAYCRFRDARLPSEAEFERAARGVNGRAFPWGELYNAHAVNHGRFALIPNDPSDGYAELAPVGSFPAGKTPEGVLDLSGNVAEWVADVYLERYDNKQAKYGSQVRVVRGGSFESAEPFLRGAARRGIDKSFVSPAIGFRCARSASGDPTKASAARPAGARE